MPRSLSEPRTPVGSPEPREASQEVRGHVLDPGGICRSWPHPADAASRGEATCGDPPPAPLLLPDPVAVPRPSVLPLLAGGILSSGGIAGCFIRPDFMVQNAGNKSECRAITYWTQLLWGPGAGRQDPAAPGAGGTEES